MASCSIQIFTLVFTVLFLSVKSSKFPCYYVFGDSLADNGNNNKLSTLAKADFPPYGIDFPDGPTGRFTNGKTIIDVISKHLGFKTPIPPFATATGAKVLRRGVNYASGAAGIRDETGSQLGDVITMNEQLKNHEDMITTLVSIYGGHKRAEEHLNRCLYTVNIGSNDYINNYFRPEFYNSSKEYSTPATYSEALVSQYSQQLRVLYGYGARKIGLFGVGQVGCTPNAIYTYGTKGSLCVDHMNEATNIFNLKLKSAIDRLNIELPDAKFIFLYPVISPDKLIELGLVILGKECCKVHEEEGQCIKNTTPCPDRLLHAFWDSFHPTEAINLVLGKLASASILTHFITDL